MRILQAHNMYQHPGGEETVVQSEASLLEERGHRVIRFTVHNDMVRRYNSVSLAMRTIWNQETFNRLRCVLQQTRPNVVHVHNTLPLLSPSIYYAAKMAGIPVVQTLHNYRLICPSAVLFREGRVCEDCVGRTVAWPGVFRGCYRDSRAATGVVATMLCLHRVLKTWTRMVDVYIALNDFARQKFIKAGLPEDKVVVKPNFVHPDPGVGKGKGGYALFVGRLSPEKGIETLLAAWERLRVGMPLKIVGEGPLGSRVADAARRLRDVEWLGRKSRTEVLALMRQATFLVFPSEWYEGFGMTIAEAYACGLPVIASNIGTMSSLVDNGRTGLHFRPSDPVDLAEKVEWLYAHPEELERMRSEARAEYEAKYTADRNYQMLMEIYNRVVDAAR